MSGSMCRISLTQVGSEQGQLTVSSEVGHWDPAQRAGDASSQEAPSLLDAWSTISSEVVSQGNFNP